MKVSIIIIIIRTFESASSLLKGYSLSSVVTCRELKEHETYLRYFVNVGILLAYLSFILLCCNIS